MMLDNYKEIIKENSKDEVIDEFNGEDEFYREDMQDEQDRLDNERYTDFEQTRENNFTDNEHY